MSGCENLLCLIRNKWNLSTPCRRTVTCNKSLTFQKPTDTIEDESVKAWTTFLMALYGNTSLKYYKIQAMRTFFTKATPMVAPPWSCCTTTLNIHWKCTVRCSSGCYTRRRYTKNMSGWGCRKTSGLVPVQTSLTHTPAHFLQLYERLLTPFWMQELRSPLFPDL